MTVAPGAEAVATAEPQITAVQAEVAPVQAQVAPAGLASGRCGPLRRRRLQAQDLGRALGAQVLRHVVVRGDKLPGLVELPHGLGRRLAARPRRGDAPRAVLATVCVPGDLFGVDAVLAQAPVDHLGKGRTLVGGFQFRTPCVLRQHRALLQHRAGVAEHAVDGHPGDARDLFGRLAGADARLDVAGREGRRGVGGVGNVTAARARRGVPVGPQGGVDTVVYGQGQKTTDLIGKHKRLAVLGEGDETHRPHRVPPSHPLARPSAARFHTVRVTLTGQKRAAPTERMNMKQVFVDQRRSIT